MMKRGLVGVLLVLTFVFGLITGRVAIPQSARAASTAGAVQSWGLISDPTVRSMDRPRELLVLFDSSTGEVWGYPITSDLRGAPVRIGTLTKVGVPLTK